MKVELYFSDYYGVGESALEEYGAFNVSVVSDLPLFIDPFLLVRLDFRDHELEPVSKKDPATRPPALAARPSGV